MDLNFGRSVAFGVLIGLSAISIALACGTKVGNGWGQEVIVLPKPTLIPKLAAAFHDGKASVAHKGVQHVVHPKLKGGFVGGGAGWGGGAKSHGFLNDLGGGHGDYEYGYAVSSPITRDVKHAYEKGSGDYVKGHYATNDGNSFKNVNYESNGGGGGGFGGHDNFGDYGK